MDILVYYQSALSLAFFPMYITGLDGQARRMYTYSEATGFGPLNMLSFVGAGIMAIGFALIVYNIYYSIRYASKKYWCRSMGCTFT